MGFPAASTGRADQIFRTGPEDLVAASSTIIAGTVSGYSKEGQRYSGPGASGSPLEWTAHAQIDRPIALKGMAPPTPIYFSRDEFSFMAPPNSTTPIWEADFGELKPGGQAVLFFSEGSEPVAVPAGGASDLVNLVKNIVRIQALRDPAEQGRAWLLYLKTAPSAEGSRVAMRSLVRSGADWNQIETAVQFLPSDADLRAFAFAFVAFHVAAGTWEEDSLHAVEFLCRTFSDERNVEQQLRALQSFKLLLRYTTAAGPSQEIRHTIRGRLLHCLQTWAAHGLSDPQLVQEYKQIQSQY